MKADERDELLIRIDERVQVLPAIEKHLEELNNSVAKNAKGVALNKQSVNKLWAVGGGAFTLICSIIAITLKVLNVY